MPHRSEARDARNPVDEPYAHAAALELAAERYPLFGDRFAIDTSKTEER